MKGHKSLVGAMKLESTPFYFFLHKSDNISSSRLYDVVSGSKLRKEVCISVGLP